MKKFFLLIAVILTVPVNVQAANFGFGLSLNSDDAAIYVPIRVQDRISAEPYFRWFKSTEKFNNDKSTFEQYEIGFGLFYRFQLKDAYALYTGSRFAYMSRDQNFNSILFDGQSFNNNSESDGFKISPTLGFEYFFTKNISLSGEIEWFYQEIDQKVRNSIEGVNSNNDQSQNGTDSRVLLRFYF